MDITAIERKLNLYGLPVLLMLIGFAGLILIDPNAPASSQLEQIIAPAKRAVFFGVAGLTVFGAGWVGWNAWREYRWSRGELNGGCHNCGGPIRHLDGRYGAYSKCLMCGSKRKGWH